MGNLLRSATRIAARKTTIGNAVIACVGSAAVGALATMVVFQIASRHPHSDSQDMERSDAPPRSAEPARCDCDDLESKIRRLQMDLDYAESEVSRLRSDR